MTSTSTGDAFAAQSWPVRLLRALTASAVSVLLAVEGHRFGGGDVVSPALLAGVFGIVLAVSFLLGKRRITSGQIVGLLLLGQVAVHTGCMAGAEPMSFGPTMLLGHLLATALAAVVLERGETVLWALADHLALQRLQLLFHRLVVAAVAVEPRSKHDADLPRLNPRAGGVVLRGPPVSFA